MTSVFSHKLFAWAFILVPCISLAQQPNSGDEVGLPLYFDHFSPRDYGAHPQNWCITQDSRGVVYVGNYDGVLAYDGINWQLLRTPTNTTVRSMAADDSGYVYVGLQGDLGFITADSSGQIRYESLADHLDDRYRDFRDVWSTHVTDGNVYFQTKSYLMRWNGSAFKVWTSQSGFHTSFLADSVLYIRETGIGLKRVSGDSLTKVEGGEKFEQTSIFMLEEHPSGGLLIATHQDGLILFKDGQARRIEAEIGDWMLEHRVYHGASFGNGYYALAFMDGGGVVVIDSDGNVVDSFVEGGGIPDGWVNHVFVDKQEGLWLALNNKGIVRMDALSALTRYDNRNGLEGVINDIRRVGSDMYAATSTGLYRLHKATSEENRSVFARIPNISPATGILPVHKGLLATTHTGLVHVSEDLSIRELSNGAYFSIAQSNENPAIVYLGSKTGVSIVAHNGSEWGLVQEILPLKKEVFSLVEAPGRNLWLSTRENDVLHVQFSELWDVERIEQYELEDAEIDDQISINILDEKILFATTGGILFPGELEGKNSLRLVRDATTRHSQPDTLLYFKLTDQGDLWKVYPNRVEVSQRKGEEYTTTVPPLLSELKWGKPVRVMVDSSGVAWISSGNMVVRYDPALATQKTYEAPFPALVRRITTIDSNAMLFGGAFADEGGRLTSKQQAALVPQLAFEHNALRFEFTLPSYNDVAGNEFQYYLEGKDGGWSDWTSETTKNYTNLGEGTYAFHIRGRNAQGFISSVSEYAFTILPPWYRSVWAYGLYLLGFAGAARFIRQHRLMVVENIKAREQAKELAKEREVNERLNDLNRRLKQANESLVQADRLKDEFLANTSHELRTPLTGILGCAAILAEEVNDEQREFIEMIDQNGHRLLHTLDSLLELARLRAGLLELEFVNVDVGHRAHSVAGTYRTVVEKKAVSLSIGVDGDLNAWMDDHCLQCVLHHLIGNAVKFTEEGTIDVSIRRSGDHITLMVADTGIGIDESFLPFLFDEFKQESTGLTRSHEGNGLGLAVTARILDLMGGEIEVQSQKGVGTTFSVYLPVDQTGYAATGDGYASAAPNVHLQAQGEEPDRAAA